MAWSLTPELQTLAHQAFILFHQQPPVPMPAVSYSHECTSECPWFEFQRFFICRISGSIHFCTEDTCDRYVINREGRPCVLTGIIYPLQLTEENDRLKGGGGSSSVAQPPSSSPASVSQVNNFRQILFTLMSVKNGTPGKYNEAVLERQLFGKHVAHMAARVCDHLWQTLCRTRYYQQNAMKYKVDYHGLVVLYQMLDGFEIDESQPAQCLLIVPRIPVMRQVLPQLKCINQTEQWRCALYTPADKFFHACLQELSTETLRNIDVWMRQLLQRCKM